MIRDERLADLITDLEVHLKNSVNSGCDVYLPFETDCLAALRELQHWRSGVEPKTGSPIGRLLVMEPWTDETE